MEYASLFAKTEEADRKVADQVGGWFCLTTV